MESSNNTLPGWPNCAGVFYIVFAIVLFIGLGFVYAVLGTAIRIDMESPFVQYLTLALCLAPAVISFVYGIVRIARQLSSKRPK
jgi:hypothetical protein